MTRRQRALVAFVLVVGVVVFGVAVAGWESAALAGLAAVATIGLILLIDQRRRLGDIDKHTKQIAQGLTGASSLTKHLAVHERRVLAAVEAARLDELDGFEATKSALEELTKSTSALRAGEKSTQKEVRSQSRVQMREIEALFQLYDGLHVTAPMPSSGGYALRPTGLLHLVRTIERVRPRLVVELGSGTSTVWVAATLRALGGGRVVSVDHLEEYAEETRAAVALHGLDGVAEVRCAPLQEIEVDGVTRDWYDLSLFDDLHGIDVLLVDGPPQAVGPNARRPAFSSLSPRLADEAWIVVDDANRADERQMVDQWLERSPDLTRAYAPLSDQILLSYLRR